MNRKHFLHLLNNSKPITDVQRDLTQSIKNEITPVREGIQDIAKALIYPSIQLIESHEEKPEMIGDVAVSYLRKFTTKDVNKTYGIYDRDGHFYIGDIKELV